MKGSAELHKSAFIAVFVAALWSMMVFLVWGVGVQTGVQEKRTLAAAPQFPSTWQDFLGFPSQVESWINDHLPFKNEVVNQYRKFSIEMFAPVKVGDVVLGSDGWLFFAGGIPAFMGNKLADHIRAENARVSKVFADYASERSLLAYYVVAPNKVSIVHNRLPVVLRNLGPSETSSVTEALASVAASGIPVIDLKADLLAAENREETFHKTDTHWTDYGSWYGALGILKRLAEVDPQVPLPVLSHVMRKDFPLGDLIGKLGVSQGYSDADFDVVDNFSSLRADCSRTQTNGVHYARCVSIRPLSQLKILVFHDSFGYRLIDKLSRFFKEAHWLHKLSIERSDIESINPDVVIYERVERSADNFYAMGF